MEEDLRQGLLSRKGNNFDKQFESCMVRITRIKQRNDVIQKQLGTEVEESIREEVHSQKAFIEVVVTGLRKKSPS